MRPLYENANDLRSEKNLISHVSDCWNVVSYKLPMSYKIDYAMYRDDILIGFAEVKCRTHKFGTFPTYIISLAKVMEARRLARETDTKSILIVSWTDKIGYLDFLFHHQIRHGGRADRNDWQDQEPVCHFDLKHFKGIGVRDAKRG
tara:strand:- start:3504 stop:3941 length:438 start_codon:yes stop_codon:yes gene_type:complete